MKLKLPFVLHTKKRISNVSVIVPTMNSERYLGILLDFIRPHFQEIIVGVDSKSNQETYDCANSFNCRTIRIDNNSASYAETMIEQFLPFCSNNWVLRLDDDELISLGLIKFIKDFLPDLKVEAVGLHRKWCRLGSSTLLEYSFYPSYQFDWQWSLFRKDRVQLSPNLHTPGYTYTSETKAPLDAFIVHLDWIYHSYQDRKAKVEFYQSLNKDLGFPDYYLYEDIPDSDIYFAPVWEEDFDKLAPAIRNVAAPP